MWFYLEATTESADIHLSDPFMTKEEAVEALKKSYEEVRFKNFVDEAFFSDTYWRIETPNGECFYGEIKEKKINFLEAFIEEEVPFRLKNILLLEGDQFGEIASECINALWGNTDIMFDYDAIDAELNRICDEFGVDPTHAD